MKYKYLVPAAIFICCQQTATAQGFLKKMKNRAVQAAENVAGNKVDAGVNKAADKTLSSKKEQGTPDTVVSNTTAAAVPVKAYSKYDFVAGSQLLVADDFSQDEIGSFADRWNTNGKAEVVTLGEGSEKWLRLFQQSIYTTPNARQLPESFTIEFDMILDFQNKGYSYPEIKFSLFNSGALQPTENAVFTKIKSENAAIITLQPGEYNNTHTIFSWYAQEREQFKTPFKRLKVVEDQYRKPMHIAMSVHKKRFRLWVNEEKVYDLPKAIEGNFNQLAVGISSSNYTDEQTGMYLANLKIAGGLPDARSKLLTEGKLVSTAINFDVSSDRIKATSFGAIKEIAEVLQANPMVNILIIGHTDSDGDEKANLQLSIKRALAVKQFLTREFGISEARLQTNGKGESAPLDTNNSPEAKAINRRVEFIKQ
jgi:outer membrane protein OmpA-like peptidoglycan-associated protein